MLSNEDNKLKRKVAIYIRVSTQEQNIDGYSLLAQRKKLVDYVNNNPGLNLITNEDWIYEDTHTGSDLRRPELDRLREGVKRGDFDAILVWKIDRLSRSLKHLLILFEEFEKNEASFISVQENIDFKGPIGKLIFQIFGAIAQFERELIKGRTLMGKIASAEMGNFTGSSIPYGYKPVKNKSGRGKKLKVLPKEKEWVEKMYEWYVYEDLGFGQIATRLTKLKVPKGEYTKFKNKLSAWHPEYVGNILKNRIYRGEYVANKIDDTGKELPVDKWTIVEIPPCVTDFLFYQAQNALKKKKGGWSKNTYVLSGKLRDLTVREKNHFVGCKRNKGGFSYRRKQFTDSMGLYHPVFEFPAKQLEDYTIERIKEALGKPDVFIKRYLSKKYTSKTKLQKLEDQLKTLRLSKLNKEMALGRVEQAYEDGNYSSEKMAHKSSKIGKELTDIESEILTLEDEIVLISSIDVEVGKLREASKQIKYKLEKLTDKQKRILVDLFVERIDMSRVKVGKKWNVSADIHFRFNPEKVKQDIDRVRTQKSLQIEDNAKTRSKNKDSGEKGGSGYIVFTCGVDFKKHHYFKDLGDRKQMVEEVYLVGR